MYLESMDRLFHHEKILPIPNLTLFKILIVLERVLFNEVTFKIILEKTHTNK